MIAAFVAGLAGSLYAHEVRYLAPNDFTFWKSIEILIMVVIGGVGSLAGAILGAAVVVGLPEFLREIGDYRMLVFGAILIATMLFGEGGLAAHVRDVGAAPAAQLGDARCRRSRCAAAKARHEHRALPTAAWLLEAQGVTRRFGGLLAVDGVDLAVAARQRAWLDRAQRRRQDHVAQSRCRRASGSAAGRCILARGTSRDTRPPSAPAPEFAGPFRTSSCSAK